MDSYSLNCTELGKLVLSSGLLSTSWSKISEMHESSHQPKDSALEFNVYRETTFVFVVFSAPPVCGDASLNSGSTLVSDVTSQDANLFSFLCSKKTPSFSLHTHALQLFASAVTENNRLIDLKSELLEFKKPVIITGAALGGSIASLFTLWLLEKVEPKLKRPLCITFGSPFIGDAKLQQILENSVRNSCFLHVADATQTPTTEGFKPFGTYLICNGSGCDCIDDPKAVMGLLLGGGTDLQGWRDYGEVLKSLDRYLQWRMCLNRKQFANGNQHRNQMEDEHQKELIDQRLYYMYDYKCKRAECKFVPDNKQVQFNLVPYRTIANPKSRVEIVCAEQVYGLYVRQTVMMLRNILACADCTASNKLVAEGRLSKHEDMMMAAAC
uniref:Fungal lipase-type domain-containing protein n=1 Tax=Brassica oleracea var. oleracea TaxID=109376 RepID=A0A0D3EFF4_BRAOL